MHLKIRFKLTFACSETRAFIELPIMSLMLILNLKISGYDTDMYIKLLSTSRYLCRISERSEEIYMETTSSQEFYDM